MGSLLLTIHKKRRSLNIWALHILLIVFFIATPILTIFLNVFKGKGEYWDHIYENLLLDYVSNTVILLIGAIVITVVVGVAGAWVISTCEFPGRKFFSWALILPLSIPTYIMAYVYAGLLDYSGPIQSFFRNSLTIELHRGILDIMNIWGAIFVMAMVLYPYVYISTRASFQNRSRSLIEASRVLGGSMKRTFFKVALPLSRPAIIAGLSLVVMEVLNDYGAVKYYGVPTFTTGIFRAWFSLNDIQSSIFLSVILMCFVFGLILLERWQRGNRSYTNEKIEKPLPRFELSKGQRLMAFLVCLIPFMIGFVIPLLQLLYWAYQTAYKVIDMEFFFLVFNSFKVAFVTALVSTVIAIVLVYAVQLNRQKLFDFLSRISTLGYSMPGAIIALGIMIPMLFLDKNIGEYFVAFFGLNTQLFFTGTIIALIFAYVVRFLVVTYNPIEAGFKAKCKNVEEVSRSLGVSPLRTLLKINLPLLKSAAFGGGLMVFVDVLKELPLTLILRPFNFHTLATKTYELASDELIPESASASIIIILTGLIPIFFLNRLITNSDQ
ncbi:iron ABC transporter permease [Fulvivirgaceae bacterium BMA10]|uniref:Iron ABC transporter permease n=1 Tax=Splendidivirga corallicola TaxID=3051826 RepID=A0ABT8KPC7_9BACT|nr:iron ABC transporter permease [Fulvivirgaceae bacterium BMA10]